MCFCYVEESVWIDWMIEWHSSFNHNHLWNAECRNTFHLKIFLSTTWCKMIEKLFFWWLNGIAISSIVYLKMSTKHICFRFIHLENVSMYVNLVNWQQTLLMNIAIIFTYKIPGKTTLKCIVVLLNWLI